MDKKVPAGIPYQHQKSIKEYTTKLPGYVPVNVAVHGQKS